MPKMKLSRPRKWIGISLIALICAIGSYATYNHFTNRPPRTVVMHNMDINYVNHQQIPIFKKPIRNPKMPNTAQSALILDCKSGQVLYSKNATQERKVASTAKLMTLYLVQHKANKIHGWNKKITIPSNIAKMNHDQKDGLSSELKLNAGQKYTVQDLYKSALVESSDSASIVLGEWVAGNNDNFVKLMNAQARAWHLKARFISASGLENDSIAPFGLKVAGGKNSGNTMSALDLAIVTQHLLKEFPQITNWSSQSVMNVDGARITNINANLKGQTYYVPRCDGLKTGFTQSAGYCYVGSRKQDNSHRIAIVLDDPNEFRDGKTLLER